MHKTSLIILSSESMTMAQLNRVTSLFVILVVCETYAVPLGKREDLQVEKNDNFIPGKSKVVLI